LALRIGGRAVRLRQILRGGRLLIGRFGRLLVRRRGGWRVGRGGLLVLHYRRRVWYGRLLRVLRKRRQEEQYAQ
jgi:hypothetical protein